MMQIHQRLMKTILPAFKLREKLGGGFPKAMRGTSGNAEAQEGGRGTPWERLMLET
jgi:hypothetical protein